MGATSSSASWPAGTGGSYRLDRRLSIGYIRPMSTSAGHRRVRALVGGSPADGRLEGGEFVLDDGRRIPEPDARFLAPVQPSKIIAVHLTYASRVDEYAARRPAQPSYFMKPPSALNGHRGE